MNAISGVRIATKSAQLGSWGEATQAQLINFIERKLDGGVKRLSVAWYGGEPTLYLDIVITMTKAIRNTCASKNCAVDFGMITNGYNLGETTISQPAEAAINTVQITLDGDRDTHNGRRYLADGNETFDRIVENVFKLASAVFIL